MNFDVLKVRSDFPIFNNNNLIYFDSASTTQKPDSVINTISHFYENNNANVHRGTYQIAETATKQYENARSEVAKFINADNNEIIFTKGTTESINLIAYSLGMNLLNKGDEIIITEMEHHSNIIPWQIISKKFDLKLKYIPLLDNGTLNINILPSIITKKTKLISITQMSNLLGTINPVKKVINVAQKHGIQVLIDAAQSISHIKIDVKELDCDYLVFSGHKIMGPTGVGVFYGKEKLLESLPPFLGGGHMIKEVTMDYFSNNDSPWKFEAGTPNIAQAIGLGEAIKYYQSFSIKELHDYTTMLFSYLIDKLHSIPDIILYPDNKINTGPVVSFVINNMHAYDIAKLLDTFGICIRAGHHCAQPILHRYKLTSINRISLYFYNTKEEINQFCENLLKVIKILS